MVRLIILSVYQMIIMPLQAFDDGRGGIHAHPPLQSIRVVSQSADSLKPCYPLTVIFEVTFIHEASPMERHAFLREVSKRVRVNETTYLNRLSDLGTTNDACLFELADEILGVERLRPLRIAYISALCQVDLKERACLFEQPGPVQFQFWFDEMTRTVLANVEALSSDDERNVLETLKNEEMALLLVDPTNPRFAGPKSTSILKELIDRRTSYSSLLSIILALADRPSTSAISKEQNIDVYLADLQYRRNLLSPVVHTPLMSSIDVKAARELLRLLREIGKIENEATKQVSNRDVEKAIQEKLAMFPLQSSTP